MRLGIIALHRCHVVALDERRLNPSIPGLIAVKLMEVIATLLARIDPSYSPLKERPATVINKVPLLSLICDECDIFAAARSGCP